MNARVGNITVDCEDVLKVAAFWSAVLGRPLDPGAGAGFAAIGGKDAARAEPAWYFAKVPEAKQAKNRMHVDLVTPHTAADLVALGATVVGEHEVPGGSHAWTVLQDPEGNEFCIAAKSFTASLCPASSAWNASAKRWKPCGVCPVHFFTCAACHWAPRSRWHESHALGTPNATV